MKRNTYPEMLFKQKDLLIQKGYNFAAFQSKSILERYRILHSLQEEYLGSDKPINHIIPIVSVCIPTYQQHGYIRECVEGALMQQTSFPFEIVIGDDGSVDGTTEICMEYAEKYPDKIRFYNRTRELCRVFDEEGHIEIEQAGNWWWTLQDGRGIYIAICEGDDYWIDPLKLQKQVDILENSENVGLCYTKTKVYNQTKNVFQSDSSLPYKNFQSLLLRNPITTLTTMYRKELCDSYLKEVAIDNRKWLMGDYPLWLWIASQKDVFFINEVTAVYRYLENSASHSHGNIQKQLAFNDSVRSVRLYFIDKFCLDESLILLVNDDYYRRNVYNGIINRDRIFCLQNLKNIRKPTFRDRIKLVLYHSSLLFNLLTFR